MNDLDENFAFRVSTIGPPESLERLTDEQVGRLSASLPRSLMTFLVKYGFGSYFDGLYRMCDPNLLRSVLALLFKADRDFHHRDCHVVGYSAFGHLWVWSEQHGVVEIDLPTAMLFSQKLAPTIFKDMPPPPQNIDPNRAAISLIPRNKDAADFSDAFDEPMYNRCREIHGDLTKDECYGFFPALALAGTFGKARRVENIKRVKALEHFAILAQLDTFFLTRIGFAGFEAVRPIG